MLLVQCPQPGKADNAQLPWEHRALCPWPKCAKANSGGDAAALHLQATCLTPAGWEAKVTLLKEGFTILEKIPSSGFLAEKKWGHPALSPASPGRMCLAQQRSTSWDVLLHCTVPLHRSKACQESPCSQPQARDHLCLTSNSSNYYRTSKYFIYKVVWFYFTEGAAERMFLVQLYWQQAIHIHCGCLGIYFTVEDIYFFVKLVLLVPYPNKAKTPSSHRVLGYLPSRTHLGALGVPGRRGEAPAQVFLRTSSREPQSLPAQFLAF